MTPQPVDRQHEASLSPGRPRVGLPTKLFYGLGSIAFGVKDNGFQTFLVIFYSQLVGMRADAVGLAIFLALMVDAFIDPMVGQVSDHWRSRWGRRHPFMYLSAAPLALSYLALWNPPHWSNTALFAYLLGVAIVVRTFISFYEIPSSALVAELTDNYDERTKVLGYRYAFGWLGGLGMVALAYGVFLRDTPQYPQGQLNPHGYSAYGTVSAVVMFAAILISAAGTHRFIPYLKAPSGAPRGSVALFREMIATLSHRSFLMLFLVSLLANLGQGVNFGLSLFFATWVWELNSAQILILVAQTFLGAMLASFLAPAISRRIGKKAACLIALPAGTSIILTPLMLRMIGLFPANHSAALLPTLLAFGIFGSSFGIAAGILISSMIADVVEDSEVKTGRRSEGLFFAGNAFAAKVVTGAGTLLTGLLLTGARFPAHAVPGHVPQSILRHLVLTYAPTYAAPYALAVVCLAAYQISRAKHEANLRELAAAAEVADEPGAMLA